MKQALQRVARRRGLAWRVGLALAVPAVLVAATIAAGLVGPTTAADGNASDVVVSGTTTCSIETTTRCRPRVGAHRRR